MMQHTGGVLLCRRCGREAKQDLLVIHDMVDLMAFGEGHLLEQGHQLGVPVQHHSVVLSYHCTQKAHSCGGGRLCKTQYVSSWEDRPPASVNQACFVTHLLCTSQEHSGMHLT